MKIKDLLHKYQSSVSPYHQEFFSFWLNESTQAGRIPQEMLNKFIDIFPRGKQLRGALSLLGYQLAGGKNDQEMLKASITLELLESSVLIADDIFDHDLIRRGIPTIHKQWEKELSLNKKIDHIDLARNLTTITIMNGYYLATHNLSRTQFSAKSIQQALEFYSYSSVLTGIGEALDIYTVNQDLAQKQASAHTIHKYKTIWYSAILPLKFGAILAQATPQVLKHIHSYGEIVGSIFQMQDDILGSFGDPKVTGKANTQDIQEGRWTVLIEELFKLLQSHQDKKSKKDYQILAKLLDQPTRSPKEVSKIKEMIQAYAILDIVRQKAHNLLDKGLSQVDAITKNTDHQDTLRNILYFVLERQK